MGRAERNASKKKKRKWPKVVGITILLLVLAAGGYAFYLYQSIASTVDKMHQERGPSDLRKEEVSIKGKDPISILLVGVDERAGDKGRTDSIVVVSVNPNKKSMEMLSIPRDTRVEIVGKGEQSKINHAYAYGGIDMTIDTVEKFLDVPIDYFVKVNMEGFQQIIDALGGVEVQNTFAFSYEGEDFPIGELTLDGTEALKYSRMRYEDPKGDFGRQDRQRAVIQGVIDKGASFSSITKFDEILEALGENVTTNMTFDEMKDIQANYKDARQNVQQFTIKGTGKTLDAWYYIVPEEERLAVSNRLKEHLEID